MGDERVVLASLNAAWEQIEVTGCVLPISNYLVDGEKL